MKSRQILITIIDILLLLLQVLRKYLKEDEHTLQYSSLSRFIDEFDTSVLEDIKTKLQRMI